MTRTGVVEERSAIFFMYLRIQEESFENMKFVAALNQSKETTMIHEEIESLSALEVLHEVAPEAVQGLGKEAEKRSVQGIQESDSWDVYCRNIVTYDLNNLVESNSLILLLLSNIAEK